MKKFFKGFHKRQRGFTLIELLVVIAILGVLAAIVIPNVASLLGSGDKEANDTELHNMQTSVLAMMVANNQIELTAAVDDVDGVTALKLLSNVGCTDSGTTANDNSLDYWFIGGDQELKQAYDIALDGSVSVS